MPRYLPYEDEPGAAGQVAQAALGASLFSPDFLVSVQ